MAIAELAAVGSTCELIAAGHEQEALQLLHHAVAAATPHASFGAPCSLQPTSSTLCSLSHEKGSESSSAAIAVRECMPPGVTHPSPSRSFPSTTTQMLSLCNRPTKSAASLPHAP